MVVFQIDFSSIVLNWLKLMDKPNDVVKDLESITIFVHSVDV